MNTTPSSIPSNWAAELRDLVNRAFDSNEMHELAFDFKLDFDDLPGRGKSGKVVELLQMLARQKRIPEFIERCQALRPRENWQPLLDAANKEPLSFHVDYGTEPQTAVSPSTSSPLQNKKLLMGIAALALIVVAALVIMNLGGGDFGGDEGLVTKLGELMSGAKSQTQLFFDEGLPGWQVNNSQQLISDGTVALGTNSILVRDRTFSAGQAILLDFRLDEVSSSDPVVTFSLQNAANREDATRIISLQALTQPESTAIENGTATAADQFARNTTLVAGTDYTVVMGFDANGRFLASLFGFSTSTEEDAKFIHIQPDWVDENWWFHIETDEQSGVTLLGGWDFTFDSVNE